MMALQSQQHTNLTIPQLRGSSRLCQVCQVLLCFRAGFAGEGLEALLALLTSTNSRNSHRSPVIWQHQGCQRALLPLTLLSLVPPAHQGEAQVEPGLQVCSRISSLMTFPAWRTSSETHLTKHTFHPGDVTSQHLRVTPASSQAAPGSPPGRQRQPWEMEHEQKAGLGANRSSIAKARLGATGHCPAPTALSGQGTGQAKGCGIPSSSPAPASPQ